LYFLTIVGFVIEIIGFFILVKHARLPRNKDLKKWVKKNEVDFTDAGDVLRNFPDSYVFFTFSSWHVPKTQRIISEFLINWEQNEKVAIFLILIGLSLQLVEILINSNN